MWANIELKHNLTLGKLREILNNELSEFPDDTVINMWVHDEKNEESDVPVVCILGDEQSVNFYNY